MDWKTHIEQLLAAGATPAVIASRIGVTPNAVREVVAGRTKAPRADAAIKLARLKPSHFKKKATPRAAEEVADAA